MQQLSLNVLLAAGLIMSVELPAQEIRLTQVTTGINLPSDIQSTNDSSERLFLVQQNGLVRIYRGGALVSQPDRKSVV